MLARENSSHEYLAIFLSLANVRRVINLNKLASNGQFGRELHLVRRYLEPPLSPFRRKGSDNTVRVKRLTNRDKR